MTKTPFQKLADAGRTQTEAQALLEKLAPYARSVLQEHRTRNKSDSAWHTRRIDGTGLTYGTLRKIVELVDDGK